MTDMTLSAPQATAVKAKTTPAGKRNDRHDLVSATATKAKTTAAGKRNQTYMTLSAPLPSRPRLRQQDKEMTDMTVSAPQATVIKAKTVVGKINDRHDCLSATSHCH